METCDTAVVKVPYALLPYLFLGEALPDAAAVKRAIAHRQAQGWTLLSRREEAPRTLDHVHYRSCCTVLVFQRCIAPPAGPTA